MTGPVGRPLGHRPGVGDAQRRARQAATAQAAVGFAVAALGSGLALLGRDLDVPATALAWLPSAFGAGLLVVGLASAVLLRQGTTALLRGAALVTASGAVVMVAAPAAVLAGVGALLLGTGAAGLVLVTPALVHGPDSGRLLAR